MYDYEPTAPGELSVQESEILLVYETEQDWLLVQSQKEGGKAGFVPGNYVEAYSEEASPPVPQVVVPPSVRHVLTSFSRCSIIVSLLDL
jgi:actin cytoskeleton-regulatory complex protein SLA1